MSIEINIDDNVSIIIDKWVLAKNKSLLKAKTSAIKRLGINDCHINFKQKNMTEEKFIGVFIHCIIRSQKEDVKHNHIHDLIAAILSNHTLREFLDHIVFLKEIDKLHIISEVEK